MAIQTISTAYNPISGVFGTGQVQIFADVGSSTWTVPPGIGKVRARVWGGGGYNLGCGGGFSLKAVYNLTGVTSVAITVGTGGTSGTPTGGTSSFGSYCSATGGSSGGTTVGSGTGGDINYDGGRGGTFPAGVASIFGPGNGELSATNGATGGAGQGAVTLARMAAGGFLSVGGIAGDVTAGAIAQLPTSGLGQFSIDYIGTGGGGGTAQNGINGGGGGGAGTVATAPQGGIPGGAGGTTGNGGRGLVIVEW